MNEEMNTDENKIRVIIADDHPIIRHGISKLIEEEKEIEVCGEAENVKEALEVISNIQPDIAIIDINFDDELNGIDLVKAINERFPDVLTLVLSIHKESTYAERAIRAGAKGYISKNEAPKKIVDAIKCVIEGELFISKDISDRIIGKILHKNLTKEGDDEFIDGLSNRELEIFELIGNGLESREIAYQLNISQHTIETHRRNIKKKLGLKTNSDLIKTAAQWAISNKDQS
ncbi:MAG: response regulator transcription factor [bacterium]|nr:response regulator transcription factor [bacterium]